MNLIKIFFDTNVLVYAHDESAIYHPESAELLQMVFEGIPGLNPLTPAQILTAMPD